MRSDAMIPACCETVPATQALAAHLLGLGMGVAMITSLVPALVATLRMLN